jgi:hypothetical protein
MERRTSGCRNQPSDLAAACGVGSARLGVTRFRAQVPSDIKKGANIAPQAVPSPNEYGALDLSTIPQISTPAATNQVYFVAFISFSRALADRVVGDARR